MNYEEIIPSTVLHWNYRGFTEFPIEKIRGEESAITDIYLKENLISHLPRDIGLLEHLESLYISGNDIVELPKEISKLRCLKCLDVSGNRLRRIPDEIGDVRCLKFLILDENELSELPLRIAELRYLRYLSVCDNKLQWLPQKPVYNYHHCEFRFWRNSELTHMPYSLWYHMFRDQQTRSLNIGCLKIRKGLNSRGHGCQLKIQDSDLTIRINLPPQHRVVKHSKNSSPPSLFEVCKRIFYQYLYDEAKSNSSQPFSIYSNNMEHKYEDNNNLSNLQNNFEGFNINRNEKHNLDKRKHSGEIKSDDYTKFKRRRNYFTPDDIIEEHFNFLPIFLKSELMNGPITRCENVDCKKPIFDYVYYEFCLGKIILIDNTEEVILSAAFCSKSCADLWKCGKVTIPWTLFGDS
ncbi:leucine-rich repeat-containing protein 39 [Manduca sexta]|uniref:leucine-rich repeat-containing protein 39 n=1 Tax=Manduca sexta TaxID=7130 RepID=UPI0011820D00|nr:leucine-rich repeat-containing protein 39 [Manduca sexta]